MDCQCKKDIKNNIRHIHGMYPDNHFVEGGGRLFGTYIKCVYCRRIYIISVYSILNLFRIEFEEIPVSKNDVYHCRDIVTTMKKVAAELKRRGLTSQNRVISNEFMMEYVNRKFNNVDAS
jgi:hypothetical protein